MCTVDMMTQILSDKTKDGGKTFVIWEWCTCGDAGGMLNGQKNKMAKNCLLDNCYC